MSTLGGPGVVGSFGGVCRDLYRRVTSKRRISLGGVKENFYRGRHRLKTYVRVQESSRNVMRVRVWAETLVIQGVLFGVTTVAGMLQAWRYTYRTAW